MCIIKLIKTGLSLGFYRSTFNFQEHVSCDKLPDLIIAQKTLVDEKCLGSWLTYKCINCDTSTHAVHKSKGLVLIPTNLLVIFVEIFY